MTQFDRLARSLAERPRPVTVFGAPEGYDAAVIGGIVAEAHTLPWLHVCRDDGRMARFAAALAFFHPALDALTFPAWDCLPYDRVSPNGEILSRRIDTLTRLASAGADTPLVVLTTVNALVQRVPPRRLFSGRVLTLRPTGRIGLDRLQGFSAITVTSAPTPCASPASSLCAAASSTSTRPGRPSHCGSTFSATPWRAFAASIR